MKKCTSKTVQASATHTRLAANTTNETGEVIELCLKQQEALSQNLVN
jgi:hypothetical protein